MRKLSTGQDSTLENWISLSEAFLGKDSKATIFLINKADQSPNGLNEEVIAEEEQLLHVLLTMHTEENE